MAKPLPAPQEHFHIGTVLSVTLGDPEFSGQGLLGQARLLNFMRGLIPEVNSVILMDPPLLPGTAPDALAMAKDDYKTLLAECRDEILQQYPRLKSHDELSVEDFMADPYVAVATYGLRLTIKGKAPQPA